MESRYSSVNVSIYYHIVDKHIFENWHIIAEKLDLVGENKLHFLKLGPEKLVKIKF